MTGFKVIITKQNGDRKDTGPVFITKRRALNECKRWARLDFVKCADVEEVA